MNKIIGITIGVVLALLLAVPLGSYLAQWINGLDLSLRDTTLLCGGIVLAGVLLYAAYEHVMAKYDAEQDRKAREAADNPSPVPAASEKGGAP